MTLTMLVAWVLFAQLVAFWALALVLWLMAEFSGIEDVPFSRAVAGSMFVLAINFLLIGVAAGAQSALDWVNAPPLAVGLIACLALVQLVTPVFVFRYYFHTTFPRALMLWVAGLVAMGAAGVLMGVGIRAKVADVVTMVNSNMAPEFRPEYGRLECANCGREYAAGISPKLQEEIASNPAAPANLVCPHCGFSNSFTVENYLYEPDRVLVDKSAKATKDAASRWKIFAYRAPVPGNETHVGRLVGLPGETVQIAGGDLFVNQNRLQKKADDAKDLWVTIYDSSVLPKAQVPGGPGWEPHNGPAWEQVDGKWKCAAGPTSQEMRFSQVITDAPTFDSPRDLPRNFKPLAQRDVQVTVTIEQITGAGNIGLRWDFGDDSKHTTVSCGARISPKAAKYRLVSQPVEKHEEGDSGPNRELADILPLAFTPGVKFTFGVRDGVTYVAQEGQVLAILPIEPLDLEAALKREAKPHAWNLLRITAMDCQVTLSHVRVERDVYYRTIPEMGEKAGVATASGNRNPTALSPSEFLILGDNSAHSYDSRFYGPVSAPYVSGAVRSIVWPRERWHTLP